VVSGAPIVHFSILIEIDNAQADMLCRTGRGGVQAF
jgi:hypothetical protein